MMPSLTGPIELASQKKVFEMTRVGSTMASTVQMRTRPGWDQDIEGLLCHDIEAYVLTDRRVVGAKMVTLSDVAHFSAPTTWWDHFKVEHQGWFWGRVSRRWPAKMTTHAVEVFATEEVVLHRDLTYPLADLGAIQHPDLGRPVVWEYYSSDRGKVHHRPL